MDYAALKQLDIDAGTSGLSPQDAANQLNTPSVTVQGHIAHNDLLGWASANGRYKALEDGKLHVNADVANLCRVALSMLNNGVTEFHSGSARNMAAIDALIAAGVLEARDKTDLLAEGARLVSPAADAGLPPVKPGHVQDARRL